MLNIYKNRKELLKENSRLKEELKEMERLLHEQKKEKNREELLFYSDFPVGEVSEQDLKVLLEFSFEVAADEVFWLERDSKIIYVNDSACKRLGYTREEMIGMHIWDWNPSVQSKEVWSAHARKAEPGKTKKFESIHKTKSGEIFPVKIAEHYREFNGKAYFVTFVNDITEQKMLEEKLREKNREFGAIYNSIADGIIFTDTSGHIKMVNPAFETMFGYCERDVVGKSAEIFYESHEEPDLEKKKRFKQESGNFLPPYATVFQKKDGSLFHTETHRLPVKDTDGTVIGFLGIVRDITEQELAEKKYLENRARLLASFDSMTDGILITDKDGKSLECNGAWARLSGYKKAEDYLKDFPEYKDYSGELNFEVTFEDGRPASPEDWPTRRALQGEKRSNEIYLKYDKNTGQTYFRSFSFAPMLDKNSEIIGAVIVVRDVTAEKEREKEYSENRARLLTSLDSITDGIMFADKEGNIIDLNKSWTTFLGFENKEEYLRLLPSYKDVNINMNFEVTFEDGTPAPTDKWPVSRALRGEKVINQVYKIYVKERDKTYFGSYCSTPVQNEECEIIGAVVVGRDITEQKENEDKQRKLEYRLRHTQKVEALATLSGGVAHDFNNILEVIMGYTELARMDFSSGSEFESHLEQVLQAADKAKELVKQILVFSCQSKGEAKPLKIGLFITETLKRMNSTVPEEVDIVTDIDSECSEVLIDTVQVDQILINLCTNAYHAIKKDGGTLSITLTDVVLSCAEGQVTEGEYVRLSLSDTGTGIRPDIVDKIFDPYFTTKKQGKDKGSGMGLATVYGIMEACGGGVTVDTKPGKGTTFHAYFPVYHAPIETEGIPETGDTDLPAGTERILLVDDEDVIVQLGRLILEKLGYHVTSETSSVKALELFESNPDAFDLVFTDQTMPEMTGKTLADRILQLRPGIPVIICSGYSNVIDEEAIKALGIRAFLPKPFSVNSMATVLRDVLDSRGEW